MKVRERLNKPRCLRLPGIRPPGADLSSRIVGWVLVGLVLAGLLLGGCKGERLGGEPPVVPGSGSPPPLPPEPAPELVPLPEPLPSPDTLPGVEVEPDIVLPMPPPLTNGDEREEVPREAMPDMSAPVNGGFPAYPWPPEAPSSLVSLSELFDFSVGGQASLFDVAEALRTVLRASGYLERRYYAAPGGFVMVTRLEQTDELGTPLPDGERYLLPDDEGDFSFAAYIRNLFFAPEGYYRFIAFVVTDRAYTTRDAALAEDTALERLRGGSVALPPVFRERPFSDHHRVDALIYEFRLAARNATVEPVTPGRLPPETHLEHSGLANALRRTVEAR